MGGRDHGIYRPLPPSWLLVVFFVGMHDEYDTGRAADWFPSLSDLNRVLHDSSQVRAIFSTRFQEWSACLELLGL